MITSKSRNGYDDAKMMLKLVRKLQSRTAPGYGIIQEQEDASNDQSNQGTVPNIDTKQTSGENQDFTVINNLEVQIHSEDPEDLVLKDDEKDKISQLVDSFRTDVSETGDLNKLHIYPNSAKLDGKIDDAGLSFTLSTGDDNGVYLSNTSLLKIDDNSLAIINKLKVFEVKFSNLLDELLVNRKNN
jgi:hypothetical protein